MNMDKEKNEGIKSRELGEVGVKQSEGAVEEVGGEKGGLHVSLSYVAID